jgi:hypothetical protein
MIISNLVGFIFNNPDESNATPNKQIINYTEYLAEHIASLNSNNRNLVDRLEEIVAYMEYIKSPEDIPFKQWLEIKDDEIELQKIKRERTIDEIIK